MTDTTKTDCDKGPFTLDWSDFYAKLGLDPNVDPITLSEWEAVSGSAVIGADVVNLDQTSAFIIGGTFGEQLVIKNSIEIDNGTYCQCHTLFIEVTL